MNNQNVTKRSSTASSAVRFTSDTTSPITTTTTKKRVKRIRRKSSIFGGADVLLPLILGIVASILMVIVVTLIISNVKSSSPSSSSSNSSAEDVTDAIDAKMEAIRKSHNRHNHKNKYNDLDAENEPLPEDGLLQKLRNSHGKYRHSDWMQKFGDHSTHYTNLRKVYDAKLPFITRADIDRVEDVVASMKKNTYTNEFVSGDMSYDIHNCPDYPPPNYPHAWNVKDVLDNWPTDDTFQIRKNIHQGLCVFDQQKDEYKALNYREAEVPFVVQNDPTVMRTVERWAQPGYITKMVGERTRYRTEFSHDNHFMYWQRPGKKARQHGDVPEDWKPPTEMKRMPFPQWLEHANITDEELLQPDMDHWYFRLIGCGEMGECDKDSSEYLFDELAFFQPRDDNPLYMVEPRKQKGIHCRFGMKGVTAENHFDGSRNMIALLSGERRYLLSHPDQCQNLALYPRGHPSARHSEVDWSKPDWEAFPDFLNAEVNEVVLQAGDVLYLPTNWFHHIVSLDLNFQCNTRSGVNKEYMKPIHECGF
jgi:hypothetical protein